MEKEKKTARGGVMATARKRTLAALVAAVTLALAMALTVPAFAADPPEYSNLYIHKNLLTDITDAGSPGTGEPASVPAVAEPVNGVVFNIYRVDTTSGMPAAGKVYKVSGTTLSVYESNGTTLIGTYPLTSVASVTTGAVGTYSAGTALRANLPHGVYVIEEDLAASTPVEVSGKAVEVNVPCAPFLLAIPMTNAAGTDYLTDIHVYPKNGALIVEKETSIPDGDAIAVGDTVPYTITTSIPFGVEESLKYLVTDQLDAALDLVVPAGGLNAAVTVSTLPTNTAGLVAGTDYTVTYASRLLTVAFTPTGRAKLQNFDAVKYAFNTTVNATILTYADLTVGNGATFEFTNKSGDDFEADTDIEEPQIHVAGIRVTKIDQANQPLNGSTFKVATTKAKAEAGEFLRKDPATSILYDSGTPQWTTLGATADYAVSPANVGSFLGLKDKSGGVWQTYWVVETVAPAGYNLISEPFEVTFNGTETNYTYGLSVTNNKGFILPETGGMGTLLFAIGGIVLLGVAAIVVIAPWKRRKANSKK